MNLFTKHPSEFGMTYTQHLHRACKVSSAMCWAGIACGVHAIFPFLFTTTASDTVKKLNKVFV